MDLSALTVSKEEEEIRHDNKLAQMVITREDVRACRSNGLYTNTLLISLKYLYKVFELR